MSVRVAYGDSTVEAMQVGASLFDSALVRGRHRQSSFAATGADDLDFDRDRAVDVPARKAKPRCWLAA